MSLNTEQVQAFLQTLQDPEAGVALLEAGRVRQLTVEGNAVTLDLELGYPVQSRLPEMRDWLAEQLRQIGADPVKVELRWAVTAHAVQSGLRLMPGVRNIIAVASGKGGVGKSTTAANLALALAAEGARVGVLDADIYGPSQPTMLGISGQPRSNDGATMVPLEAHGLQVNSIGFLVDPETPMVWRGPMVTQALEQLLRKTQWNDLDYLVVDMPPGTGDIQLTLSQKVPVTGAVIVTTPQDIALIDARRGLKMFEKVGIPILGVVENMSMHVCSQCGHTEPIFGEGGGQRMAQDYDIPWLGGLPLALAIREHADSGRPSVVAEPDGAEARAYRAIARRLAGRVAMRARDMTSRFPSIVVQNT
ncbi:MAG: iron-sulfur cluster carrier protein ApbC [Pigmentiphaga sp.]|nr:iron-sulfur cluster carrier protein ApbC [Pigmentiphaga sp.]